MSKTVTEIERNAPDVDTVNY